MVRRLSWALGLALVASCAEDEGPVSALEPEVALPEALDFGEIPLGTERALDLEIENTGDGSLVVQAIEPDADAITARYRFELDGAGFTVPPGDTKVVPVRFTPLAPQEQTEQSGLTIVSNLPGEPRHVRLDGRGVGSRLEVVPEVVDFGSVLWGSDRSLTVDVINRHDVQAELFVRHDEGRPRVETIDGAGRFELTSRVDPMRGGALLPAGDTLQPGEAFEAELRYVATPGDNRAVDQGRWWLATCAPGICAVAVPLRARPRPDAFDCAPAAVDFGRVEPDERVVRTATCTNVVSETVDLLDVRLEAGTEAFELVAAPTEVRLEPGDTFSVQLAFAPPETAIGNRLQRALTITHRRAADFTDDVRVSTVELAGTVGRPRISVEPARLRFSPTALGTETVRRLRVRNTGWGALSISSVTSSGPFAVEAESFSVPPKSDAVLEVRFAPLTAGLRTGGLELASNDAASPTVVVPLEGEGVLAPPCRYRLSSNRLDLGVVEVGRPRVAALEITNEGGGECLLNDLRLVGGSTSAFALLDSRTTGRVIGAGTSTTVQVALRAAAEVDYRSTLELYLSHPDAQRLEIPVLGRGVRAPLVISPPVVEVGPARAACAAPKAEVRVVNPSGAAVTLTGASLGVPNLAVVDAPPGLEAGGLVLRAGETTSFSVQLQPGVVGPRQTTLQIDVSGLPAPYLVPAQVLEAPGGLRTERFEVGPRTLDVLFVVSDQASFAEEQAYLPMLAQRFVDLLEAAGIDYQIGVIRGVVRDQTCPTPLTAQRPSTTLLAACGYLADGGATVGTQPDWRVITPSTIPSPQAALSGTIVQSLSNFSRAEHMAALWQAFTPPIVKGWNAELVRPGAGLAVIYVSEEDDHWSTGPTAEALLDVLRYAAGDRDRVAVSGAAGGPTVGCRVDDRFGTASPQLVELADLSGGRAAEICDLGWVDAVVAEGLPLLGHRVRFPLAEAPEEGTVEVYADGVAVPAVDGGVPRWVVRSGAVDFATPPEPASGLEIRYQPACQ